jgi:hypothetical protein
VARGHSFREISDLHGRAAIALGVEREWAYVPVRTRDCPACGEKVKPMWRCAETVERFWKKKKRRNMDCVRALSPRAKSGWVPNARRKRSGPRA